MQAVGFFVGYLDFALWLSINGILSFCRMHTSGHRWSSIHEEEKTGVWTMALEIQFWPRWARPSVDRLLLSNPDSTFIQASDDSDQIWHKHPSCSSQLSTVYVSSFSLMDGTCTIRFSLIGKDSGLRFESPEIWKPRRMISDQTSISAVNTVTYVIATVQLFFSSSLNVINSSRLVSSNYLRTRGQSRRVIVSHFKLCQVIVDRRIRRPKRSSKVDCRPSASKSEKYECRQLVTRF